MSDRRLTEGPVVSPGIEVAWGVAVGAGDVVAGIDVAWGVALGAGDLVAGIAVGVGGMGAGEDLGGGGVAVRLQAEQTWLSSNRAREIH